MAFRLNVPPVTRVLLAILFAFTILNAAVRFRALDTSFFTPFGSGRHNAHYLVVTDEGAYLRPWVFFTTTFVETNVFGFAIAGLTLLFGGRYLERAWSSSELAKFILGIGTLPNIMVYLIGRIAAHPRVFYPPICGSVPIQAGFLVAFKQLVPEHTVAIAKGIIKMRVKHFPAMFLLANTISGILSASLPTVLLSWIGFTASWTYLRFYRKTQLLSSSSTGDASTIRGDASDTFAFAHFFPEPIQTPLSLVSDKVYDILITLKICTPFSDEEVNTGNEQAMARAEGGLPSIMNGGRGGGRREEAERRRALALKALDQRLHAATNRPEPVNLPATQPQHQGANSAPGNNIGSENSGS